MRPEPGDLAYCVAPPGYKRTFHMRFCTIHAGGHDDLTPRFQPATSVQDLLFCEWWTPVLVEGIPVRSCWMCATWLRKVSGPGVDADDHADVCRKRSETRERIECATEGVAA